jgi:hypothetical protein
VVIAFPDGSKVDLTLRYVRSSPRPLPWPNRLIDQYEQLRSFAVAGDASAAMALHTYLSLCRNAYEDAVSLERAVERLHREGVLQQPDGTEEVIEGGDLTDVEYSRLRGAYDFCRGITSTQKAELPTWTERAAKAGDPFALTAWARSLGETAGGLSAWEKAWQQGIRSAPASLANLYEHGVPGVKDGEPDFVRAYAFRLINLKLHEAWYGETPSGWPRNDIAAKAEELRRTDGFLTPQEQAQAVQLAKSLLEQNRNCCSGLWPGMR